MAILGNSFYLQYGIDDVTYLEAVRAAGISHFFTSLHITELNPQAELDKLSLFIEGLGEKATVVADVSPRAFLALGASVANLQPFAQLGLKALRIDYGFSLSEIGQMAENRYGLRIILNASTTEPDSLMWLPRESIELWHNFYPRPETGLSLEWLTQRGDQLQHLGFRVGAFIPCFDHPRPPIGQGLPTVEEHRYCHLTRAIVELLGAGVSSIVFGDPCTDGATLIRAQELVASETVPLRVHVEELSPRDREILFGSEHISRNDPSHYVLRSGSSRSMAAIGQGSMATDCAPRPAYTVTVDNHHYQRYAGELQITLRYLPADPRINVVAQVVEEDWPLVKCIKPGMRFRFIETI